MKEEQRKDKLALNLLPHGNRPFLRREPDNSPTRLLATVLFIKLKINIFNEGTHREMEEQFTVHSKQWSKLLSGKWYLGGKDRKGDASKGPKRKSLRSSMAVKEPDDDNDGDEEK